MAPVNAAINSEEDSRMEPPIPVTDGTGTLVSG
jgi:hypothetical protein